MDRQRGKYKIAIRVLARQMRMKVSISNTPPLHITQIEGGWKICRPPTPHTQTHTQHAIDTLSSVSTKSTYSLGF